MVLEVDPVNISPLRPPVSFVSRGRCRVTAGKMGFLSRLVRFSPSFLLGHLVAKKVCAGHGVVLTLQRVSVAPLWVASWQAYTSTPASILVNNTGALEASSQWSFRSSLVGVSVGGFPLSLSDTSVRDSWSVLSDIVCALHGMPALVCGTWVNFPVIQHDKVTHFLTKSESYALQNMFLPWVRALGPRGSGCPYTYYSCVL